MCCTKWSSVVNLDLFWKQVLSYISFIWHVLIKKLCWTLVKLFFIFSQGTTNTGTWTQLTLRCKCSTTVLAFNVWNQGTLKGEISMYCWPPVWLFWNQLYDNWKFLLLFSKQTNPNRSNRRSTVQWYFPPLVFPGETYSGDVKFIPLIFYSMFFIGIPCILRYPADSSSAKFKKDQDAHLQNFKKIFVSFS